MWYTCENQVGMLLLLFSLLLFWQKWSKDVLLFALDVSHPIEEKAGAVIQLSRSRIESVELSGDGDTAVIAHEPSSIGLFHMRNIVASWVACVEICPEMSNNPNEIMSKRLCLRCPT